MKGFVSKENRSPGPDVISSEFPKELAGDFKTSLKAMKTQKEQNKAEVLFIYTKGYRKLS